MCIIYLKQKRTMNNMNSILLKMYKPISMYSKSIENYICLVVLILYYLNIKLTPINI